MTILTRNSKGTRSDPAFALVVILSVIGFLPPERLIPGLNSVGALKQVPNLLTGILFLLWLGRERKVLHNKETKLYTAFWALMILGTGLARNPARALACTKGFTAGFMGYLAKVTFVDTLPKLRVLFKLIILCNVPIALMGIAGGGQIRSIPSLADENDFALLMNMILPFCFFLGLQAGRTKDKLFYYGSFFLFLAGVVVSLSRGGFLGLLCSLAYCFSKTTRKGPTVVIGVLLLAFSSLFVPESYWQEMRTIKSQGAREGTGEARIYYWKNALKIFAHHPLIGVGPENAGVWITTYDPSERGMRDWGRALHSVYFTLLAEHGIAGAILFLAMLYHSERSRKRVRNLWEEAQSRPGKTWAMQDGSQDVHLSQLREAYHFSLALTGGLIGYLSSGVFLSALYYSWFWAILTYTVILANAAQNLLQSKAGSHVASLQDSGSSPSLSLQADHRGVPTGGGKQSPWHSA